MRVILRVDQATWDDIARRVIAAGQPDRVWADGSVDMHEVCIQVEPDPNAVGNNPALDRIF